MEISREILNSDCNVLFISHESNRLFIKIEKEILNSCRSKKKIIFDVNDYCSVNLNLLHEDENIEMTLNHTINVTIIKLRKIFNDSKIFYLEKKVTDLYDHANIHKCIVIDWNEDY